MDLNGDGKLDVLSGSYSRMEGGMAGLFQVLWGKEGNRFAEAKELKGTDGEPLIISGEGGDDPDLPRICTRAFAVDFDGDGDLDIVAGNFEGTFFVFTGEGQDQFSPEATKLTVESGDQALTVPGYHSDPFVVDWDGDGDLDLLSGSGAGGVYWAENDAAEGRAPVFKDFVALVDPVERSFGGAMLKKGELPKKPSDSTRVWADDVNGDGKLDLLVGDNSVLAYAADGVSEEEFEKKSKAWTESMSAWMKEYNDANEHIEKIEKLRERYETLEEERTKFVKEERTGFVWLYTQK